MQARWPRHLHRRSVNGGSRRRLDEKPEARSDERQSFAVSHDGTQFCSDNLRRRQMYCVQAAKQAFRCQHRDTIEEVCVERDLVDPRELAPSTCDRVRSSREHGSDDFNPSERARRKSVISMSPKKSS